MAASILIVGQGLAGTMLAWEFERSGIDFEIVDRGHARAATRIGAGIINPITGQRIVKSWRVDAFLPSAVAAYRAFEAELGVGGSGSEAGVGHVAGRAIVRSMRIRRLFADERERRVFAEKRMTGELVPYAGEADEAGFWIEQALHVDTAALIAAARVRLKRQGRLIESDDEGISAEVRRRYDLVIFCTGAGGGAGTGVQGREGGDESGFGFPRMVRAKGEILTLAVDGLAPDVILNRGHWLLPVAPGVARVGATFVPGAEDFAPTTVARAELEQSARALLGGRAFAVTAHDVGLRMTAPDRHPVVGRSPRDPQVGIFNGLGSKGALLAPGLARQWVNHLTEGVPFDADVDVARFRG